jgi:uncharacterized protein Yka (UPF0111/DUF47 family)
MKKNSSDYFDIFCKMAECSCEAAKQLQAIISDYHPENLQELIPEMHKIEHAADVEKHKLFRQLARDFISPIEREDILSLSQELDEVTDNIEDILLRLYMFNITSIRPEAHEFATIIVDSCENLRLIMEEFRAFRKSEKITKQIIEANRLENLGDDLYTKALRSLYTSSANPVEIIAWTETFRYMERCCDSSEHAANVAESVIIKNT